MTGFDRSATVFRIGDEYLWNGIPTVEVGRKGTLLVAWYSGGTSEPQEENKILFSRSFDHGENWEWPTVIADPFGAAYAFDPCLWIDASGKLWLNYSVAREGKKCEVWYQTALDYEDEGKNPDWSVPARMVFGRPYAIQLNKRVILDNGDWLVPTNFLGSPWRMKRRPERADKVGVVLSTDHGETWKAYGDLGAPLKYVSEPMVIQRTDGSLWMLTRTRKTVLWQSTSEDRGRTWTPLAPTNIINPSTRFYLGKSSSGNILLVNTPLPDRRDILVAYLSKDDGKIWHWKRVVDDRQSISYPDVKQDQSELIHLVFDHKRREIGAIEYRAFTEDWIRDSD